jgi:hypothetical protein
MDFMNVEFWIDRGWGLADPDQDAVLELLLPEIDTAAARRKIALDHLEKALARAERIALALDVPAERPEGLDLYLVAGDAEPTEALLAVDLRTGQLKTLQHGPGDGTVSRSSALMDERLAEADSRDRLRTPIDWTHVSFIFNDHLGLTKDPVFIDNLLFLLLER